MDQQWIDSMNVIFHRALTTQSSCCRATFPGNRGRFWEWNNSNAAWSILQDPESITSGAGAGARGTVLRGSAFSRGQLTASAPAGEAEPGLPGEFTALRKTGNRQQGQGMAPVWFAGLIRDRSSLQSLSCTRG